MLLFRTRIFNPKIEPCCAYCEHGTATKDGQSILCRRRGVMLPSSSCRRFTYDPLLRIPYRQPKLPEYDAEDFSL